MSIMYGAVFVQHLLLSLVPWLVGLAVGGGLGYGCALVARALFSNRPALRRPLMLLPWRTVAVTLPLLSPLIPVLLGLGRLAGAAIVGLFVFLFAFPLAVVTLLEHRYPSPLAVRLIAQARTLGTASVAVAAVMTRVAGSGGAGALILEGIQLLDYYAVFMGFSVVALLALMVDLLLGGLQLRFSLSARGAQPLQSAVV